MIIGLRLLQLASLIQIKIPAKLLIACGLLLKSYYLLLTQTYAFQRKPLLMLQIMTLAKLWKIQEFAMEIANITQNKLSMIS
jgi:hypothetical protein